MNSNNNPFLYQILQQELATERASVAPADDETVTAQFELPHIISSCLSPRISLREYQIEAFQYFIRNFTKCREGVENEGEAEVQPTQGQRIHNLFHMATGSGKTVIMAGLMLYLYTQGYRKFIFFVNQTNVLEKTIENFTNPLSSKYLFAHAQELSHLGKKIQIRAVDNFSSGNQEDIEIVFTTTQKLHHDLTVTKENSLTITDFQEQAVVFISDESHHVNSMTKAQEKTNLELINSWEYSVDRAFKAHKRNILLEFTATCDLQDKNVLAKYRDKIVYDYPLVKFRASGYTKDFNNLATDTDLWTRALIALVLSEYRKYLFAEIKLNIKPVVLFKSDNIANSQEFFQEFSHKLEQLTALELQALKQINIPVVNQAIEYFQEKDAELELLVNSLKDGFSKDKIVIINNKTVDKNEQLSLNSLEDQTNPIRAIFAVDMLNEGWDVLNLFDIVRLYDTRQGGKNGKPGPYTIKEAQLIGRGARYCPFLMEGVDEELKFKRKLDGDLENRYRLLETMFFHSKNDSNYISELKQALIACGLQPEERIQLRYTLKEEFRNHELFKYGLVFANQRIPKGRKEGTGMEHRIRSKMFHYQMLSGKGRIHSLFGDEWYGKREVEQPQYDIPIRQKVIELRAIPLNILMGACEAFAELKLDLLQRKYPGLKSLQQFLTDARYLGSCKVEITYTESSQLTNGRNLFNTAKKVLAQVATHVSSLKPGYKGTTEFMRMQLKDVLSDKLIYLSEIQAHGGKGASQNTCENEKYRLDLTQEPWYVFNDNYGTSEEKLFVKFFKTDIVPLLTEQNLEFFLVRNERIAQLALYSFESGERFEPDFLLLVRKPGTVEHNYQAYIEPKGAHLQEQDQWKAAFLTEIEPKHSFGGDALLEAEYTLLGFPFFTSGTQESEFKHAVVQALQKF